MTINTHNHNHHFPENMQQCQDHIHALEEERRKIQVFSRELPLCLDLVTQAIEACKQQLSDTTTEYNLNGQSECSEETSSDAPVLEEFIPLKRGSSSQTDGEELESKKPAHNIAKDGNICQKSDWLRSVQLWNQTPDLLSVEAKVEVNRNRSGGAFHPFKKEKSQAEATKAAAAVAPAPVNRSVAPPSTSSSAETGGCGGGEKKVDKEGQSQRKARRCWSTELHRKFLHALQQLGGSHLATPKQIRELMKVDGLTNDEVKSHLQKYRLHSRRPSPSIQNNNSSQATQFVVVGGIWVPPEYAAMAATATSGSGEASGVATSNGIYAPVAALPAPFRETSASPKVRQWPLPSDDGPSGGCLSEGGGQSHSPATSSSTHTTTASPAY
ncbi:transcription factor HHO3-like isoform X2 [Salvia splendens]|uniref:transcription factor HHO3-like isoform X2 n=1 Tax=Salvia splendens TaxID=180675 RepID=UPI001C26B526|nr:transcription factor HHO3-like isoform X2 [Salvia splendens]